MGRSTGVRVELLLAQAQALFDLGDYRRAESVYRQALQRKTAKIKSEELNTSATHIRFQIYKCLLKLGDLPQALQVLQAVTATDRTPAINMALAQLHVKSGADRNAIAYYKEVIRDCPLALDALQGLASCGVTKAEIVSTLGSVKGLNSTDLIWVVSWIEGHCHAYKKDYKSAVLNFSSLERTSFPNNVELMRHQAMWQWQQGYLPAARQAFAKVHELDPLCLDKMDIYGHVLLANGKEMELNKLAFDTLKIDKRRCEPWIVLARHCQLLAENATDDKKAEHATSGLQFIAQALELNSKHAEAYLTRGTLHMILENPDQAAVSFREANQLTHDFSSYQGLVNCHLSTNRLKEAFAIAHEAQTAMPQSARAITLLGAVCKRYSDGLNKARKAFENALALDPHCMEAVYALFDLEVEQKQYPQAIQLLASQLQHARLDFLHRRLGDVHVLQGNHIEALKHYQSSLTENPNYLVVQQAVTETTRILDGLVENEHDDAEDEEQAEAGSVTSSFDPDEAGL